MKKYDIDKLISNRQEFNSLVYTPIENAIELLDVRLKNCDLVTKVDKYLNGNIPDIMRNGSTAVIFRHVITPNYEINRFLSVPDATSLKAVFWEYHNDKFTSNNPLKHSLGKMGFRHGVGKKGGQIISFENVIDFNQYNGKKIKEIRTLWDQSLIDFHHQILENSFPGLSESLFDASNWFHENGGVAREYYRKYLALFITHGILFENLMLEGEELDFIKNKFLPAFFEVWDKIGEKPLIVALEPTEIEGDDFWIHHPSHVKDHIDIIKNKHKTSLQ